ncbi:DUF1206 domain-containing protein [Sphingomonas sp. LY29]|uniref:DUF1206 domain-containing protein n=1 Tax=Sphingomonas sp. LY29 TaxID=3095341 RepID=UPI002D77BC52|nr:DUF1206 domain-containing protein [Sphingomonas sp. LY29]WRP25112.1 DUF1206 domain-containing protein [Sphingomonas sp. LY29]
MERVRRIETWARLGYAARGLVYILLGWIALSTGKALSTGETVKAIEDLPLGSALLALVAVGLFGYGLYKIYAAIMDLDCKGDDAKGRARRAFSAIGGIGYWILSFIAVRALTSTGTTSGEDGQATGSTGTQQQAAEQVSQATGGDTLLVLIGIIVLGVAGAQAIVAYKAKFMDGMAGAPSIMKPAGQVGYAARALVIGIVGWSIVKAGMDHERMRGSGDALALLRNQSETLFQLVAVGLILFGFVSLLIARYRTIANDDLVARLKGKVAEHRH